MSLNNKDRDIRSFTTRYDIRANKLISEVYVGSGEKQIKATALWDTGATGSCISHEVAATLNLVSIGRQYVYTPSGQKECPVYCVDLYLPNKVHIGNVQVMDSEIGNQNLGVLLGMDIISLGDFAVSNYNGKTQFSFRVPSCCDADFINNPVSGFKGIPVSKEKQPQRNDLCPCGSGKKYKFCCGK